MVWTTQKPGQYPYDVDAAIEHFRHSDPVLHDLVTEIGEYRLELRSEMSPFEALFRSIVYQQLSGHAAGSILNRLLGLFGDSFPDPPQVISSDPDALRSCGLSHAKIRAVKDLAEKQSAGQLPAAGEINQISDDKLVDAYTIVRGIGPWTVEMLMIFNLGRADVLPVTDLGVRRGFMVAVDGSELPTPKELAGHGQKWKPYRSVASWYLWRAADPKFRAQ